MNQPLSSLMFHVLLSSLDSDDDSSVAAEMRKLVGKVEEMKQQRMSLDTQLRAQVHKDDVTSALVTHDGSSQEVRSICIRNDFRFVKKLYISVNAYIFIKKDAIYLL